VVAAALSRAKSVAEQRRADAEREAARVALAHGHKLEARAHLRATLETRDDLLARALFGRLSLDPELWRVPLPCQPNSVALAADGTLAAVPCGGLLYLIDTATGALRVDASRQPAVVAFAPDARSLAAVSVGGEVSIMDLAAGTWRRLGAFGVPSRRIVVSPDGVLVASGSIDGEVGVWEAASGARRHTFRPELGSLNGLAFSSDAALLAGRGLDGGVVLWDMASGAEVTRVPTSRSMGGMAFSPDGKTLAFGVSGGLIQLWDVPSRTAVASLDRHAGPPVHLAFAAGGSLLLKDRHQAGPQAPRSGLRGGAQARRITCGDPQRRGGFLSRTSRPGWTEDHIRSSRGRHADSGCARSSGRAPRTCGAPARG
jgi:hypothetical protein